MKELFVIYGPLQHGWDISHHFIKLWSTIYVIFVENAMEITYINSFRGYTIEIFIIEVFSYVMQQRSVCWPLSLLLFALIFPINIYYIKLTMQKFKYFYM